MAVHRRRINRCRPGGVSALGGVRDETGALFAFSPEVGAEAVRAGLGEGVGTIRAGRGLLLARVPPGAAADLANPEECALLAGRNVLLAVLERETPEAVGEWLEWHAKLHGVDGALIYATGAKLADGRLIATLDNAARHMEIVLLTGDIPTPDLDREGWLASLSVFELFRHSFLAQARSVAYLSVSDLLLETRVGSAFDRAASVPGRALVLIGSETFPWRLRQGKPAHHVDHVAVRLAEDRRQVSWCVAPRFCPPAAIWRPGRISGMAPSILRPAPFRRAMGVANPGVPVGKIVRKKDLVEDTALVRTMSRGFGKTPQEPRDGRRRPRDLADEPRDVLIVSAMKNEGPFILDWIAHNRAIGVEQFLIYTNDCADGTERLLDLLGDAGVTRRDNPFRETGGVPQHAAFRAALIESAVREAGWLMTLDVDEYINIRVGEGRVADLFQAVPEAGAVSLPWRLFGNADIHEYSDTPVVRQFHACAPEFAPRPLQAWAFKTLYRNDGTFGRLGVHRPKGLKPAQAGGLLWVDGTGEPLPRQHWRGGWRMTPETWGYDLAGINHYAVRSAESFLVKRERGRVNHVDRDQGLAYWFRMNHNVTEDRSITRLDGIVAQERARLAALPGVAEAHEAAVAWHRARISELKAVPEQHEFYRQITGARLEKLSRMTMNFGSALFYAGPEAIPDEIVAKDISERFYFTV